MKLRSGYGAGTAPAQPLFSAVETLASLSVREGMVMDADIYWPIAQITDITRQLYDEHEAGSETFELAVSARNHISDTLRLGGAPLTVTEIANHFEVTTDRLSRAHKRHFGKPLQAYLMRQRLDTAYALLNEEGRPVSAVTYQLGFSDVQAFNKLFRKYFGVAPSEVKKK